MIEAILCDIDGTLVQSNWLHAEAWRDAFRGMGLELEVESIRRQIGKGGDELIPVFVPWWRRSAVAEPLKEYRKFIFQQDYLSKVEPFPKVRELLLRLQQAGIRLTLASSASEEDLEIYKKIANIDDLVQESTSSDDTERAKPHPDIFQAALKKLGLPPTKVLALGDTPYDAEAAGKAGIATVGVTTGGWSKGDLLEAGCIEVFTDVADLLEHFEESAFCR